eukprot:Nk52_evm26s1401 gene=Nk52_evmTU26s1401
MALVEQVDNKAFVAEVKKDVSEEEVKIESAVSSENGTGSKRQRVEEVGESSSSSSKKKQKVEEDSEDSEDDELTSGQIEIDIQPDVPALEIFEEAFNFVNGGNSVYGKRLYEAAMERFETERKEYSHRTFFYYYGMCALEFGEFMGVSDLLEEAISLFESALKADNAEEEEDPKSEKDCNIALGRAKLCLVRSKYDKLKYSMGSDEILPEVSEEDAKSVDSALSVFEKALESVSASNEEYSEELISCAQCIQAFANSLGGCSLKKYASIAAEKFAMAFEKNPEDCYGVYREGTCYFMIAEEILKEDLEETEKKEGINFLQKCVKCLSTGKEKESQMGGISSPAYIKKLGEAYMMLSGICSDDDVEMYTSKAIEEYKLAVKMDPTDDLSRSIVEEATSKL